MVPRRELPLNIGQKISAIIRGEKYIITLRGWAAHQYLITDLPATTGEHFRVAPQTGCTVNFMRDGVFVNFKSQIIYAFAQAASLMIIEYPRDFDLHNLRDNERYKVNFPLEYSIKINGSEFVEKGTIRDMTLEGLLFCHPKILSKDDNISFAFDFPQGKIDKLSAIVRNVRKNPKSEIEPFVTGVKFSDLSEPQYQLLASFLQTRAQERRKNSKRV
ncbi:MAG: PilZ domain-containing protein [Nitrospinae bacterium]|nr:PilZ domain-containing protein [Nitrospinota bacterium]